mmetsp:Transcript_2599/g.10026  ORF Transcript_2599/g.10026 Transcript_2599/m.10026 type:complete len:344 (+) Transcript_2599:244-1275(+)
MIRRLVHNEEVRPSVHGQGHAQPALLPSGQRPDLLEGQHLAPQAELREVVAHAQLVAHRPVLRVLLQGKLHRRGFAVQLVQVVLRDVLDAGAGVSHASSGPRFQQAHDDLDQRTLAATVAPQKRHPARHVYGEARLVEQVREVPVAEGHVVEADHRHVPPRAARIWEGEREGFGVVKRLDLRLHAVITQLQPAPVDGRSGLHPHAVHLFHPGLALGGGIWAVATQLPVLGDVLLHVSFLLLLNLMQVLLARTLFGDHLFEREVISSEDFQLRVLKQNDVGHDLVQEVPVVGHDEERLLELFLEVVFEPDDGLQVQVIRGLVEQQHAGRHEERARKRDAHSPSA